MEFRGVVPFEQLRPMGEVDAALTVHGSPFQIEHRHIRGVLTPVFKNQCPNLRLGWLNVVQAHGERTYVVGEGESHTFASVHRRAVVMALWLHREFHIAKGDRVAIVARNHVDYIVAFWAIHLLGGVATLVNAFLEGPAIYDCIRDVGCKAAILDVERIEKLRQTGQIERLFGPSSGTVDDFGCTPGAHGGLTGVAIIARAFQGVVPPEQRGWTGARYGARVFDVDELDARYGVAASSTASLLGQVPDPQLVPEDLAVVLFTSGTTGKPKGVCSTHRQFLVPTMTGPYQTARALLRRHQPLPVPSPTDPQRSALVLVPLFHSTGIQSCMVPVTLRGDKVATMPKYTVDVAARMIEEHQINSAVGIGFMVRELVSSKYELKSLTAVLFGGSTSAKEIPGEFKKKAPEGYVSQGYGATEVNGGVCGIGSDDFVARPTSTGTVTPVNKVYIIDPVTLAEVPRGHPGEVWISGPNVSLGYWGRPESTSEVFTRDGFFRTGDVGTMDRHDFVYIVDRSKHIIIRGGENISGPEVENAIYGGEPRILDCSAVPVPDERLGEKVAVVCIPHPEHRGEGRRPTEREVVEAAARSLPRHAVPEFVWIRDEPLERNANGKVERSVVKEATTKRYLKWKKEAEQVAGAAGAAPEQRAKL